MCFTNHDWLNFRADMYRMAKEQDESLLKTWGDEVGFHEPIGYVVSFLDKVMEIYTTNPELVTNQAIKRLEDLIMKKYIGSWGVKIHHVPNGFTNWDVVHPKWYQFAKKRTDNILQMWCDEVGFKDPIGYHNNRNDCVMTIYTTRPGEVIGKGGETVKRLKTILSDKFKRPYTVKLVEIRGEFFHIN